MVDAYPNTVTNSINVYIICFNRVRTVAVAVGRDTLATSHWAVCQLKTW